MPAIEFDLTMVAAIWMVGVIVLVPLTAAMARYGIAPVLDAVGRMRAAGGEGGGASRERVEALERRVAALTRAIERLEGAGAERQSPLV